MPTIMTMGSIMPLMMLKRASSSAFAPVHVQELPLLDGKNPGQQSSVVASHTLVQVPAPGEGVGVGVGPGHTHDG